jgi:hypothetical protein
LDKELFQWWYTRKYSKQKVRVNFL